MNRTKQPAFQPNYLVLPGDTLQETIEAKGMSQAELAERLGRPKKTINEIIKGKTAITAETALQLESVIGVPASFWTNLEANYREALARQSEEAALQSNIEWLQHFPVKAMVKLGWLKQIGGEVNRLRGLFRFFGVVGAQEWQYHWSSPQAVYRKSTAFKSNPYAVAAWLRQGEIEASVLDCAPHARTKFIRTLSDIRGMITADPKHFEPAMIKSCAAAGVAVTFIPELPGTHLYGATRWLTKSKALIQLSLRGKTDDHLWFTFFHEAAHIVLHGRRDVFIEAKGEGFDKTDGKEKEKEASRYARNLLIPPDEYRAFIAEAVFTDQAIQSFAQRIGIAPGVVVGRLQHDKTISFSWGNKLKQHYCFKSQE